MAKVTPEELMEVFGLSREEAEEKAAVMNAPKPRLIWWQFKATEADAAEVAAAFPHLQIVKRYAMNKARRQRKK